MFIQIEEPNQASGTSTELHHLGPHLHSAHAFLHWMPENKRDEKCYKMMVWMLTRSTASDSRVKNCEKYQKRRESEEMRERKGRHVGEYSSDLFVDQVDDTKRRKRTDFCVLQFECR